MTRLHRRLAALLALISLFAFVSGAGLEAPALVPAALILFVAVFVQPGPRTMQWLEPLWRGAALLLAARAAIRIGYGGGDPVLPMVDLLLLLLAAESVRMRDASGDARHFALSFALLIAAAAYRPGALFGLLFVAWVICAILVLTVGHLSREAAARGARPASPDIPFLARLATMSLVVLGVSAVVFLFFPRVSQGWAARSQPLVAAASIGFSDRVSIGDHGATLEPNPAVVLRVEFPGGAPADVASLHLRGRAYDHFDGRVWSREERMAFRAPDADRWAVPELTQVVYARPIGNTNVLFGVPPVLDVTAVSRIRPVRAPSGDYVYYGSEDPVYRVRSLYGTPPADSLRAVSFDFTQLPISHLQLPALPARVIALADSFRATSATPYDQALAIEQWLRTAFDYTLELPVTPAEATLDHFLFERRAGHCEYFSTAMAVLLRAGGVPARNVNGFLGGEWNEYGDFLNVTQNNAHSWVEVYFPGWGWVTFDPTPAGGATGLDANGQSRLLPFSLFFQGVEHRWGKWILDYDIGTQSSLMDRLTSPFDPRPGGDGDSVGAADRGWPTIMLYGLGAVVVAWIVFMLMRQPGLRRGARTAAATRPYLRLRRAYERAGWAPVGGLGPLAFADAVAGAPGAEHARRAARLYARARFGAGDIDETVIPELRACVVSARRELRSAPRRRESRRDGPRH